MLKMVGVCIDLVNKYGSNHTPPLNLTPELVLDLNRITVHGVEPRAGEYRTKPRFVAEHIPPKSGDLPSQVQEMCDHVNVSKDPFYVAAFVLWRVCWIHPFDDGNGRVARALSYICLCGLLRESVVTEFLSQIMHRDDEYYAALEAADRAWAASDQDYRDSEVVREMQDLLFDIYVNLEP